MHVHMCKKDDIFRQRRLNHSEVGGGIAFRRVYPARAYSTVVVLVYIQKHSDCFYDWIMIIDGDGSTLLPKTCGSDIPTPIRSHTSTVVIVFHSDHSETFRGFNITWESRKSGDYFMTVHL